MARESVAQRVDMRRRWLFLASGAVLALMLALVVVWFAVDSVRLVGRVGLNALLFGFRWDPAAGAFGLLPFIWGSVVVGILALLVAIPLGVGLAVVLAKRVPLSVGRTVGGLLTGLVAVPSVVIGWWGLDVVVPAVRRLFGGPGFSLLAAGLTVAVMLVPTLAVLATEALRAVPASLEDASRALGADEDATLWRITLLAAAPGIVRAVILAAGRALAETMAVQMVIGGQPVARLDVAAPGSTLTTGILTHLAVFSPDSPGAEALTVMACCLFIGTFLLQRELGHWEEIA
jgi:phosphate transport system permease protein